MKTLIIQGLKIKTVGDFGNALVAIINYQAVQAGWIEDDLNAINDDLRQIQDLGYGEVIFIDSEKMKRSLETQEPGAFDSIIDMFSDKEMKLELR
jgi:hypothetical protein